MEENWLQRSEDSIYQGGFRPHDPASQSVFVKAQGSRLWDSAGNEWIDLVCGYGSLNFGHSHPQIVRRANDELEQLCHIGAVANVKTIELAEQLKRRLKNPLEQRVMFCSSGARAIEAAWKAAFAFRPGKIVALSPSLHGRSIATASLSTTPKSGLSEALESRVELWPEHKYPTDASDTDAAGLFSYIDSNAEELSAVLVEPVQTARGYFFPAPEFFQRLRRVTSQHNLVLVADEIQTGLGRCAPFLVSKMQGWQADLTVLGKSLGGGLWPMATVVGRKDILQAVPTGVESETFAGMPIAAAIALEVLDLLDHEDLYERGLKVTRQIGAVLQSAFDEPRGLQPTCLYGRPYVVC